MRALKTSDGELVFYADIDATIRNHGPLGVIVKPSSGLIRMTSKADGPHPGLESHLTRFDGDGLLVLNGRNVVGLSVPSVIGMMKMATFPLHMRVRRIFKDREAAISASFADSTALREGVPSATDPRRRDE